MLEQIVGVLGLGFAVSILLAILVIFIYAVNYIFNDKFRKAIDKDKNEKTMIVNEVKRMNDGKSQDGSILIRVFASTKEIIFLDSTKSDHIERISYDLRNYDDTHKRTRIDLGTYSSLRVVYNTSLNALFVYEKIEKQKVHVKNNLFVSGVTIVIDKNVQVLRYDLNS